MLERFAGRAAVLHLVRHPVPTAFSWMRLCFEEIFRSATIAHVASFAGIETPSDPPLPSDPSNPQGP